MDLNERVALVKNNAEEIVTLEELKVLLETNEHPAAYVGFEPSGFVHIGFLVCANKIKDLVKAGFDVTILLADWHAFINDKLGGSMENIRKCGKYMQDCFSSLGVNAKFVYASDLIDKKEYWEKVIRIAKNSSLARIRRAMTIMGRKESDAETDSSKLMYPSMQAADIFELNVDAALGGMDQRKAHMLARDVSEKLGWKKPIAIHTSLLGSLTGTERMESKMSKSSPESCVFIHDSENDIKRKIGEAYCPMETAGNPVIDICKHIVFREHETIIIERPEKYGGNLSLTYDELLKVYPKELHPADLKNAVSKHLIQILEPVREYFKKNPGNLEMIKGFTITR
ncbi:MAG: tyrosine--tRNA ligase [Thermoplasmatales archaeon]|nr:tyrosine--tRNA ligase [Thermoplasmatales archaeon]